jgi:hypothetical protein
MHENMETETPDNLKYKHWKLHLAIVLLSMVLGAILAIIKTIVSGFDPVWLWLIPFMPVAVYMTTFSVCLALVLGLGSVGPVAWWIGKEVYSEIDRFLKDSKTDRAFQWSEYFWVAGLMLFAWLAVMFAVFIIVN